MENTSKSVTAKVVRIVAIVCMVCGIAFVVGVNVFYDTVDYLLNPNPKVLEEEYQGIVADGAGAKEEQPEVDIHKVTPVPDTKQKEEVENSVTIVDEGDIENIDESTEEDSENLEESDSALQYYECVIKPNSSKIRVRSNPNNNSKIITSLKPGTILYSDSADEGGWTHVFNEEYDGYMASKFLEIREVSKSDLPEGIEL